MKTQISRLFVLLTMLTCLFTACEKDSNEVLNTEMESLVLKTAEDLTASDNLFDDVSLQVDAQVEEAFSNGKTGDNECVVRTWEFDKGTFPNTLTIDYGDGCTGPNGRTRSGKIIVQLSAPPSEAGAVKTVTLEDFYINEAHIEGTKVTTNNGLNDLGQPSMTRTVDGMITFADGSSVNWSENRTITHIEGFNTVRHLDDVFSVMGNANGTGRAGVTYTGVIVEPIIKKAFCPWAVKGLVEFTVDGENRTLDYGVGDCDRLAILINADGEAKEIKLPL